MLRTSLGANILTAALFVVGRAIRQLTRAAKMKTKSTNRSC
jgi:hypothetical protein